LSLFVTTLRDTLTLVTRIGWPADKRVFLPRFRVITIGRGANRRRRHVSGTSDSGLGTKRRSPDHH